MTRFQDPGERALCLLALVTAACTAAVEPDPILDEAAQSADAEHTEAPTYLAWPQPQVDDPERDLEHVLLEDERFTVVDPDELPLGTQVLDGSLRWEYVGPHEFSRTKASMPPTVWRDAGADTARSVDPIDQLRRTVRVDAHGRQWAVADLDVEALRAEWDDHDEHRDHDHAADHADVPDAPGDGEWVTPLAWGRYDCMPQGAVDGEDDQFLSDNTENRVNIGSPSGRQTKAVIIDLNDSIFGFGASCSGVLVDDQYVLTAAHCVSNAVGGVAWPELVCPLGNNASYTTDDVLCQAVASVTLGPDWTGLVTGDVEDDYALLELITPVNPAMDDMGDEWGWMRLCYGSDDTMDDDRSYNLGYPGVVGGGGNPCNSYYNRNTLVEADTISEVSGRLFRSDGDIIGWTARRIKTNHDISGGNSGSAIYVCHGGNCTSGDVEHITGLMTHHVNPVGTAYSGGPKVAHFRSWASGILPSQ